MVVLWESEFEGLCTGREDSRGDGKIDVTANGHVQHASCVRENTFYKTHTQFLGILWATVAGTLLQQLSIPCTSAADEKYRSRRDQSSGGASCRCGGASVVPCDTRLFVRGIMKSNELLLAERVGTGRRCNTNTSACCRDTSASW